MIEQIKQALLENPLLLKYNSKRLAKKFNVSVETIKEARAKKAPLQQKLEDLELPLTAVDRVKFWDNMAGEQRFSITTKKSWHEQLGLTSVDDALDTIKNKFKDEITPIEIKVEDKDNRKALFIYLADLHIGAKTSNNSLFPNEYNAAVFKERLNHVLVTIKQNKEFFGVFDALYIVNLGDALDGYNKQTTRGGHILPQNLDNNEQLDTFFEAHKNLFDSIVSLNAAKRIEYIACTNDNHCYTDDVEVLTDKGFKHYLDLSKEDLVATVNVATKEIEYSKPIDYIYNKPNKIQVHRYKNKNIDVRVTAEHRMLHRIPTQEAFKYKESSSIKEENITSIKFLNAFSNKKEDYNISDDLIKLAAWIATDGTVLKWKDKVTSYIIYQTEPKVHLIEDILKNLNISYAKREVKRSKETNSICGILLKKAPKTLYSIHINKVHTKEKDLELLKSLIPEKLILPEWVAKLSKRQFDIYLSAFADGDGTRKKVSPWNTNRYIGIYGTKGVLDQLQILCISNGHRCKLRSYRKKDWILDIGEDMTESSFSPKKQLSVEEYDSYTWCLTTKQSNFIIRSNGKVSVQGNCGSFGYAANRLLDIYLSLKYPDIKRTIITKFIDHVQYGQHTFMFTHGKDDSDMKFGLPKDLNEKTENYINAYIHYHKIQTPCIHLVKGDLHLSAKQNGKIFRYKNVLSLYGSSKWVQTNFMVNKCGYNYEIVDKYSKSIYENEHTF